jgi:hypothetical protein
MKWSDIAPQGTAEWSNQWRTRYRSMPFHQHQSDTDAIMVGHATKDGHLIDSRDLRECISTINHDGLEVIEFGGWRGAMAQSVLSQFPTLRSWTNYDICPSAMLDRDCFDSRYRCVVQDRFLWETERPTRGDIFASSHAIEHLTAHHLNLLFKWLPDTIDWMYLCAPIQDSCANETWQDYGGTHILEIGWEQVIDLLPDFRVVNQGEQFRWLERKS